MNATAVIISGQARTFRKVWKSQREAVYRKLGNPYFFASVADDKDAPALDELVAHYGADRVFVERVTQPNIPPELLERYLTARDHAPYQPSVSVAAIWRMLWANARAWEFFAQVRQSLDPGTVDTFVRVRPDLHFHYWTRPRDVQISGWRPGLSAIDSGPPVFESLHGVHVPWWGSYGGAPDRFAYIVGQDAAQAYFTLFDKIDALLADGCAFHPETLLGRALERAGVPVHETMDAEFSTLRTAEDLARGRQHDVPSYRARDVYKLVSALTRPGA